MWGLGVGQPTGGDILESMQKIAVRKKSSIKSAIWVSYDLGVQGDYPGIYSWLDEHQAIECGDNLAFLNYEYSGSLLEALTADLKKSVEMTKRTRIYVIYRDQETKKMKGNFIFGGRKAAPWSGFAIAVGSSESDEAQRTLEYALADTGLWYAMFDRHDPHHGEAKEKAEVLAYAVRDASHQVRPELISARTI